MVLAAFLPVISVVFSSLPEAVLGGCTIMMFGNIIVSGFQMIARAGFTQRNITIAALSLAVGINTRSSVGDLFAIFPELVQSVFAQNCVAVVFLVAIVANLVLPKDEPDARAEDAPAADAPAGGADGAPAVASVPAGSAPAAASASVGSASATASASVGNTPESGAAPIAPAPAMATANLDEPASA